MFSAGKPIKRMNHRRGVWGKSPRCDLIVGRSIEPTEKAWRAASSAKSSKIIVYLTEDP